MAEYTVQRQKTLQRDDAHTASKIPFYVFTEMKLRGLVPNSYIHVSVSDIHIPRIGPHFFLQQNRQTDPGNI